MSQDQIFLTGKLQEYRNAFRLVDAGGNGSIGATELYQLLKRLGNPVSYDKLVRIMETYDTNQSGAIDFPEFLRMLRDELLDLQEIMDFMKQRTSSKHAVAAEAAAAVVAEPAQAAAPAEPAAAGAAAGAAPAAPAAGGPKLVPGVTLFFSEDEFDKVLASAGERVVVLMASVTWCKPCKAFQTEYEKAAQHYKDAIFLKFYGNSNEGTKALFKDRLKARTTPSFFFFKGGKIAESCTGARATRVEATLRKAYGEGAELPAPLWLTEEDLAAAA